MNGHAILPGVVKGHLRPPGAHAGTLTGREPAENVSISPED
jgi:hypothetical protein